MAGRPPAKVTDGWPQSQSRYLLCRYAAQVLSLSNFSQQSQTFILGTIIVEMSIASFTILDWYASERVGVKVNVPLLPIFLHYYPSNIKCAAAVAGYWLSFAVTVKLKARSRRGRCQLKKDPEALTSGDSSLFSNESAFQVLSGFRARDVRHACASSSPCQPISSTRHFIVVKRHAQFAKEYSARSLVFAGIWKILITLSCELAW